jgi:hypothetical protein
MPPNHPFKLTPSRCALRRSSRTRWALLEPQASSGDRRTLPDIRQGRNATTCARPLRRKSFNATPLRNGPVLNARRAWPGLQTLRKPESQFVAAVTAETYVGHWLESASEEEHELFMLFREARQCGSWSFGIIVRSQATGGSESSCETLQVAHQVNARARRARWQLSGETDTVNPCLLHSAWIAARDKV